MGDLSYDTLLGMAYTVMVITGFGGVMFAALILWPRRSR